MKLTDALCYTVLTITMTVTCMQAEGRHNEIEGRKMDRRLSRRESTVFIDNTPGELSYHKPKVVYRKISKLRFVPPQSKYGSPRPKYGPPKASRKPAKKYRGKVQHKYGPSSHKIRSPKPRYGPPKRHATKPAYGPPKNQIPKHNIFLSTSYQPEPMGFGEPPSNFDDHHPAKPIYDDFQKAAQGDFRKPGFGDYQSTSFGDIQKPESIGFTAFPEHRFNPQKPNHDSFAKPNFEDFSSQSYGEPPVDSYGAPIKANLHDLTYPTAQSFPEPSSHFNQDSFGSFKSWASYQQDQNLDNKVAFSKNLPSFAIPERQKEPTAPETEELELNSYSDIYNYRQMKNTAKKKPYNNVKIVKKPWKGHKKQLEDEVIVGGQYAEPPARYVPKFQPSAPMFTSDDDFAPPGQLSDPELVASATNSPYVNYKNSNMAFSPQNLNDAFSIVDK